VIDVARFAVTVPNGQGASAAIPGHRGFSDAAHALLTGNAGLICYAPASLNGGVYVHQFSYADADDPAAVWFSSGQAVPGAGLAAVAPTIMGAFVSYRMQATTPPNADTTFKFVKHYATGRNFKSDVARFALTVLNGQGASAAVRIHDVSCDAIVNAMLSGLAIFSPASLNTGVFKVQVSWHDPDDPAIVWYDEGTAAVAGTTTTLSARAHGAISLRVQATTPPNADTTFKFVKQYLARWAA